MQTVNTEWFRIKLHERKLSARGLAKKMDLDPASVSKMLRGQRRMTAAEANTIARILGLPTTEVLRQAGVPVSEGVHSVSLTGVIDAAGEVHDLPRPKRQVVPPDVPGDGFALQIRCPASPADGWLILCASQVLQAMDAIERLAVIHLRGGGRVLGTIRKGYDSGLFNVLQQLPIAGMLENQEIAGANPVLWVRPR